MKRITQTLFAVAVAASLVVTAYFFIQARSSRISDQPVRSRLVEAGSAPDATRVPGEAAAKDKATSAIPLEPNETLLDLYSFNLDFDEEEEQILVIRESDDADGLVRVVLADYSPFSKRWTRAWKGSTLVTKNKTFQVSVNDLIGDHNLNIVCTGMNDANEQTMTIYWKTQDIDQRPTTSFAKVFEQAGSAVLIEGTERPDSYKLGQSNGESWPVSVWKADAESGNYLDQLRELWRWSFADRAYVLASTERIPGASIARKMAESILDGSAETFKAFLAGTWYKESIDPLSPGALFITFQSRDESVLFSGDGLIEVYGWENSNPTRYGLYIASRNQSVRNLRRLMDIELAAADAVNVRVFQDYRIKADISGRWDGRYRRLSPEMAKAFKRSPAMAAPAAFDFIGEFESDDGSSLSLDGTAYRIESASGAERGAYAVYELSGSTVLDMRKEAPDGQAPTRRSWIVTVGTKKKADGKVVRTLTLQEAKIGILGPEPIQNPPISYSER
ncbi:MAG: pallilysin-related adhesin [Spirochaetes bacterium]|nr:pallilysin-related adhesin [Spirochaetota bacterium]